MAEFLSIVNAAAYLNVDYKTIYRLVRSGRLLSSRVGGQYRITREDLETYLDTQKANIASAAQDTGSGKSPMKTSNNRCGNCFRLITAEHQRGGICEGPNCTEAICRVCWGQGELWCQAHRVSQQSQIASAQQALARGEVSALVISGEARRLESAWMSRFDERVRNIGVLFHPGTEEVMHVGDWSKFHRSDDEMIRLLQTLNTGFLDKTIQINMPHNEVSTYQINANQLGWGRPQQGIVLEARCVNHLETFGAQGFDTAPMSLQELTLRLAEAENLAAQAEASVIVGLGSPTGWHPEAVQYLADISGRAYRHSAVVPCLVDLTTSVVTHNQADERLNRYRFADLFRLPLESEEVASLQIKIETLFADKEGIPLSDLVQTTGRPEAVVRRACQELAQTRAFKLVDDRQLGPVLLRYHSRDQGQST